MLSYEIMTALALLPSRVYYIFDTALGIASGSCCPNCGRKGNPAVARKHAGLIAVRRCLGCELLYRPVGFEGGALVEAYYSFVYTKAGIATATQLANSPEELARRMAADGRDRTALIERVASPPARVCILGCSWGYEMLPLRERGYDVFGIELSRTRRAFGRDKLGLPIYANVQDAAEHAPVDVVLSSHVLEHVPRVTQLLETVVRALRPTSQIHVTPCVEGYGPQNTQLIGREHPIGLTQAYWARTAVALGVGLEFQKVDEEAVAVLVRQA
jgi:SAM-dependent methyltransferase